MKKQMMAIPTPTPAQEIEQHASGSMHAVVTYWVVYLGVEKVRALLSDIDWDQCEKVAQAAVELRSTSGPIRA